MSPDPEPRGLRHPQPLTLPGRSQGCLGMGGKGLSAPCRAVTGTQVRGQPGVPPTPALASPGFLWSTEHTAGGCVSREAGPGDSSEPPPLLGSPAWRPQGQKRVQPLGGRRGDPPAHGHQGFRAELGPRDASLDPAITSLLGNSLRSGHFTPQTDRLSPGGVNRVTMDSSRIQDSPVPPDDKGMVMPTFHKPATTKP